MQDCPAYLSDAVSPRSEGSRSSVTYSALNAVPIVRRAISNEESESGPSPEPCEATERLMRCLSEVPSWMTYGRAAIPRRAFKALHPARVIC